jgi:DNA-binding transcriptional regulator YiaG
MFDRRKAKRYNSSRSSTAKRVHNMVNGRARPHGFTPERIQKILDKTGWSQTELARQCGVRRNTLHNWLRGKRKPNAAAVRCLQQVEAQVGIKA